MTQRVLNDMTRLASTLVGTAEQQLDSVLKEFVKPPGAEAPPDRKVDAGTLAASVMQVVSKLGTLMVELSKYDLVRRNDAIFRVGAHNAVSSLECERNAPTAYAFWVENESNGAAKVSATLVQPRDPDRVLSISPKFDDLQPGERRRVTIEIPGINEDGSTLLLEARVEGARKDTCTIRLIPKPPEIVNPNANA